MASICLRLVSNLAELDEIQDRLRRWRQYCRRRVAHFLVQVEKLLLFS